MTGLLRATTRPGLTAQEAITWWSTARERVRPADPPIGFGFSARAATWWRLDGDTPANSAGQEADLSEVYELVGFDGDRELRWRNENAGRGRAVVLAGAGVTLPAGGTDVSHPGNTATVPQPQVRMLAGQIERLPTDGWVRLTAARYAPLDVPVVPGPDADLAGQGEDLPVVVLEVTEYTVEDEHGNLTVADSRCTRLLVRTRKDLQLDLRQEA